MIDFLTRLDATTATRGRLCVGIDPHPVSVAAWGLDDDIAGLERFSRGLVDALGASVASFKPQSAFFEAFGPDGLAVLSRVLADIADAGAISILDVKRGDIGSTMAAYARAYLADGAALAADAITVSPFLGFGSLEPAVSLARQTGRGLFALTRTSNPEGRAVQLAVAPGGASVAQEVVDAANASNAAAGVPVVGLVIGATLPVLDVNLEGFNGWVLAPGIGAQGGDTAHLRAMFGGVTNRVLPVVARFVSDAGPSPVSLAQVAQSAIF